MRELGICWRNRLSGDHAENLENAIACYQQAALFFTRADAPVDWAAFARNLLDEEVVQNGIDFNNLTGMTNDPRQIGAEVVFRW